MDEILIVVEKPITRGSTKDGWLVVTEKDVENGKIFRKVKNCELFTNVPKGLKDTYHIASEREREEFDKLQKKAEKVEKPAEPVKVVKQVQVKSEVK